MALDYQTKSVFLNKGMRDDVDYTLLEPPHCQLVRNGRFQKKGSISKRLPVDVKINGPASGQPGEPLAVIERDGKTFVQGTEGVYIASDNGYKEVTSKVKPSSIERVYSTDGKKGFELFDFSRSENNLATISLYRQDDRFDAVEFKYIVDGVVEVLETNIAVSGTVVDVFCSITDNVVLFCYMSAKTGQVEGSLNMRLCNLDGTSFRSGITKLYSGEQLSSYTRLDIGEAGGLPDCLYTFRSIGSGQVAVSAYPPTLVGGVSGYSTIDLVGQTYVGDTGYVFDSSGEFVTLRLSRDSATSINRYFTATGGPVGASERVETNVSDTEVIRVSMTHDEGEGYAIAYLARETETSNDGVQFADFQSDILFVEDPALGFRTSASQNGYTTYVYERGDDWDLVASIEEEGPCADIYYETNGSLVVPCFPVHQSPLLAENPDGVAALSFPLGWKPRSTNLYAVDEGGTKSYAILGANESLCWDGFRKSSVIGHTIFSSVPRSKSGVVANRLISSAPDLGLATTGSPQVPSQKDRSLVGVYRMTLDAVSHGFSGRASSFGRNVFIPSGSPGFLDESGLSPLTFLNGPEITSVFYRGEFYREAELAGYTNAVNEGFPSTGYAPKDLFLDSKFSRRGVSEPGNEESGTSHNMLVVGLNVVLVSTRGDGTKVRSAPSQTLYVPAFYHEYVSPSSGGDIAFLVTLEDLDIGVYAPAVRPDNTFYEVYISNAALTGLSDPPIPITISTDPVLLGVFEPSNKSYNIDFGGVHGAVFKTKNRIEIRNWAGYYQTNEDSINTKQGPRFQSRAESGLETLYTVNEPSADTLGNVSQFAAAGNTLFYASGDKVGFTKPWRFNIAPEAPALYIQDLPYPNPKTIAGLDDKLILFYDDFIYVMFGESPGVDGSGGGYVTQKLPGDIGLRDINSVVEVPGGIMFRSRRGFYLLNRGLVLEYKGGVEDVIRGTTVTAAVNSDGESHVIFSLRVDDVRDSYNKLSLTADHPPGGFLGNGNSEPIYEFIQSSSLIPGGVGGFGFGLPEKPLDLGERTLVDTNPYAVVYNYNLDEWSVYTNHDFVASEDIAGKVVGVRSDWTLLEQRDPGDSGDTWGDAGNGTVVRDGRNNFLKLRSAWSKFGSLMDRFSLDKITALLRNLNWPAHGSDVRMVLRQDYEANDTFDPGRYTHKQLRRSNDGGANAPDRLQVSLRPKRSTCQSFQVEFEEFKTTNEPGKSFTIGKGFEVIGVDPEFAPEGGSTDLPSGRQK